MKKYVVLFVMAFLALNCGAEDSQGEAPSPEISSSEISVLLGDIPAEDLLPDESAPDDDTSEGDAISTNDDTMDLENGPIEVIEVSEEE